MKSTTSTEKLSDILATSADFDGVVTGRSSLELLAMFWALARFDEGFLDGGEIYFEKDEG